MIMNKIFYYYGTMKASKTTNLLMVYHNYEDKGIKPLLVKPETDTRTSKVTSRVGIEEKANYTVGNEHPKEVAGYILATAIEQNVPILLDECQFFSPDFVKYLCEGMKDLLSKKNRSNVCIMAYGLLKNFMGNLFKGSIAWLEFADNIREIKTICARCNSKATYNVLFKDGKVITHATSDVFIGDLEYVPMCSFCWLNTREEKGEK